MCADAAVTFRRQTATAAWGRPRLGQGDHEGRALPDAGEMHGVDAGNPEDNDRERQPRIRRQIHIAAVIRGRKFAEVPSKP